MRSIVALLLFITLGNCNAQSDDMALAKTITDRAFLIANAFKDKSGVISKSATYALLHSNEFSVLHLLNAASNAKALANGSSLSNSKFYMRMVANELSMSCTSAVNNFEIASADIGNANTEWLLHQQSESLQKACQQISNAGD